MPVEMQGRRVPLPPGADPYSVLKSAGDYCGPVAARHGETSGVYFLLPVARDPGVPGEARSMHHVESPPHAFREEADGTLTVRESIGAGPRGNYYWHGYLTRGRWQLDRD